MTQRQKFHLYLPAWKRAAQVQGWNRIEGRRLAARRAAWGAGEVDELYQEVWARAHQEELEPALDDLRHAVNWVATGGRADRAVAMFNWELNRAVALMELLADPEDTRAMIAYAGARRRGLLYQLSHTPPAVLNRVSRDIFGVDDYRRLGEEELLGLARKFQGRNKPRE